MKKIITIIIFLVILYLLHFLIKPQKGFWVCKNGNWTKQGNPGYTKPVISCNNPIPLGKTKEECLKQGGVWEKQGPEPFETCDRKTIDNGNTCRDNSECEGMCQVKLTDDEMSQGMRGKVNINKQYGTCSQWVVTLGCQGMMKNGKVQVICID